MIEKDEDQNVIEAIMTTHVEFKCSLCPRKFEYVIEGKDICSPGELQRRIDVHVMTHNNSGRDDEKGRCKLIAHIVEKFESKGRLGL